MVDQKTVGILFQIMKDFQRLTGKEFLKKYPKVEAEVYWNGEEWDTLEQAIKGEKMSKDEAYIKKHELTEQDLEKLERNTISQHCRMELLRFASFMEDILQKNDYKGGWRDCPLRYLQDRLIEEVGEYFGLIARNIDSGGDIRDSGVERKELGDIANFCLMLWTRGLPD